MEQIHSTHSWGMKNRGIGKYCVSRPLSMACLWGSEPCYRTMGYHQALMSRTLGNNDPNYCISSQSIKVPFMPHSPICISAISSSCQRLNYSCTYQIWTKNSLKFQVCKCICLQINKRKGPYFWNRYEFHIM